MTTSQPASRRTRANGDGTVYQRQDGRWEAAGYVLAPGNTRRRVRVYGATRAEALAKLTEKIATSNRGIPAPTIQGTLGAYLDFWLDTVAVHRLCPHTLTRYRTVTRLHIQPTLGKKKLARLTAKDVRLFLDTLRVQCRCCTRGLDSRRLRCCAADRCCQKRLSPLTLAYIHSLLKSVLEHAVREEEIPRNVARNVRMGTPHPRRHEPLTTAEARRLLDTTQGHRLHALFELALHTGLRKGELLGLRWNDLDLDDGTATIRRTLQRLTGQGLTQLPVKTRTSERRIALPTRCIQSLKLHRERQEAERTAAGDTRPETGYVFTTVTGNPIEQTNLTRTFHALLRQAGLRRIRFHDLRHTTATLLLEQGVELVVIKELLGHAHIGVTATVYANPRELHRMGENPQVARSERRPTGTPSAYNLVA